MRKVEHRIEQLTKRIAGLTESVDALLAEYAEGEAAHGLKLEEAKKKAGAGKLSESERSYYKQLSVGLKTDAPLSVIMRMFLTEQTETGYKVLGSDRETWYEVPDDLSYCPCPRFSVKNECSHLAGIRLLTQIKYAGHVDVTFGRKGETV